LNTTTILNSSFEKWQNLVDMVIDGGYGDNVGSIIDLSGEANGTA
jgi:hypothetical protein